MKVKVRVKARVKVRVRVRVARRSGTCRIGSRPSGGDTYLLWLGVRC